MVDKPLQKVYLPRCQHYSSTVTVTVIEPGGVAGIPSLRRYRVVMAGALVPCFSYTNVPLVVLVCVIRHLLSTLDMIVLLVSGWLIFEVVVADCVFFYYRYVSW